MSQVSSTTSSNATNSPSAGSTNNTTAASTSLSKATTGSDALANESTFLKLLVAQLQNQDPTQPSDGTQFVTQLAQFSNLEQSLAMRTDLDTINGHVSKLASSVSGTPAASTASGTSAVSS